MSLHLSQDFPSVSVDFRLRKFKLASQKDISAGDKQGHNAQVRHQANARLRTSDNGQHRGLVAGNDLVNFYSSIPRQGQALHGPFGQVSGSNMTTKCVC